MRRDVFQAIADPTRREIIQLIALQPLNLNTIAEKFDVSRPAISKHIKILAECGIVIIHTRGRERFCEARLQRLQEVQQWVSYFHTFWNQKLDALGHYLKKEKSAPTQKSIPSRNPPARSTARPAPSKKPAPRISPTSKRSALPPAPPPKKRSTPPRSTARPIPTSR